jgi:hypothetical protein
MKLTKLYTLSVCSLLFSCSSVHKLQEQKKEKMDSIQATHIDSQVEKHIDTSRQKVVLKDHSLEIQLELETDSAKNQSFYQISYDKKNGAINSNVPIKKAVIRDKDNSAYSNFTGGIDSSFYYKVLSDTSHVRKKVQEAQKEVEKKGVSFAFKAGIIVSTLVILAICFLIAYIRKKKKPIEDVAQVIKDLV